MGRAAYRCPHNRMHLLHRRRKRIAAETRTATRVQALREWLRMPESTHKAHTTHTQLSQLVATTTGHITVPHASLERRRLVPAAQEHSLSAVTRHNAKAQVAGTMVVPQRDVFASTASLTARCHQHSTASAGEAAAEAAILGGRQLLECGRACAARDVLLAAPATPWPQRCCPSAWQSPAEDTGSRGGTAGRRC